MEKSKRTIIEEVAEIAEAQAARLRTVRDATPDSPWEWRNTERSAVYGQVLAEADALDEAASRLRRAARRSPSLPHPPHGYAGAS